MPQEPAATAQPISQGGDPRLTVEVLGVVGAAELASFSRLAKDAQHAPDLPGRITLSRMAAGELAHLDIVERLAEAQGVDFLATVETFQGMLGDFDRRTSPNDWWERLMKTYVGYGVVLDFQREVSAGLDGSTRSVLVDVLADNGHGDYVVSVLAPVIGEEPQLGARLALWGRRVVGEAIGVVQRALADHPGLIPGAAREGEAETTTAILNRLAASHARRLGGLGLTA